MKHWDIKRKPKKKEKHKSSQQIASILKLRYSKDEGEIFHNLNFYPNNCKSLYV